MGPKFVPSPKLPVDLHGLYEDFNKFADRLRWHHHFNHKDPDKPNTFVKPPWYQPTGSKPPPANAAIEAFILMIHNF